MSLAVNEEVERLETLYDASLECISEVVQSNQTIVTRTDYGFGKYSHPPQFNHKMAEFGGVSV